MEEVIKEEGGMILINKDCKIETRGFTRATKERIQDIIKNAFVVEGWD